jgi:hypothetical protein
MMGSIDSFSKRQELHNNEVMYSQLKIITIMESKMAKFQNLKLLIEWIEITW